MKTTDWINKTLFINFGRCSIIPSDSLPPDAFWAEFKLAEATESVEQIAVEQGGPCMAGVIRE
jgi:hypothetical protein